MPLIDKNNLQQALTEFKENLKVSPVYSDPMDVKGEHKISYANISTNPSSPMSLLVNTVIPFSTITGVGVSGSLDGVIILKSGKTYKINAGLALGTSSRLIYGMFDYDNDTQIGNIAIATSASHSTAYSDLPINNIITVGDRDINICFKAVSILGSATFTQFNATVQEIAQPVVVEYNKYNEISNPLTTTDISQESPVGSVIKHIGEKAPEHYLICDGSEYNIADYPHLAEYFKREYGVYNYFGGDGITTFAVPNKNGNGKLDVTPVLTSNSTPSPYNATASSEYGGFYAIWKAFNGTVTNAYDAWAISGKVGWIMLDCGRNLVIDSFAVVGRNYTDNATVCPKDFTLQGSYDGVNFDILKTVTNETNWTNRESREYQLSNVVSYRYYKLDITNNNGNANTIIGDIKFFRSVEEKDYIKYEPTYYAVNQYGGFESAVLFDGNANTVGEYILNDDVNEYDFFTVEGKYNDTSGILWHNTSVVDNVNILNINYKSLASQFYHIPFNLERNKLTITAITRAGWTNPAIAKLVGYKGQLPSLLQGGIA